MADHYRIKRNTLSSTAVLAVTAAEYRKVVDAVDSLVHVVDLEEAYDIVISNYADYEKAVAGILIEEEVRQRVTEEAFARDRRHMSRMTANLLSSIKLFQDLCEKVVPRLFGRAALADFRGELDRIAAGSFPYRVMDALRNHAQHEHFAVTGLSYGGNWIEHGNEIKATRVHTFKPSVNPKVLRAYKRFKDIVVEYEAMRKEDPAVPAVMDLTLYVRSYVASIGDVLLFVRKMIDDKDVLTTWAALLERHVGAFTQADGNTVVIGISAEHLRGDEVIDERHLGGELSDAVMRLRSQNRKLVNLHRIQFRL